MKLKRGWCATWLPGTLTLVLGLASSVSADPPPAFQATVTLATAASGPIVKLSGRFGSQYTAYDVADNTLFDLREMRWEPRAEHPLSTAFSAGEQPNPPSSLTILHGVVDGRRPIA